MDLIDLAQDRDKWQVLVNMVMKFCLLSYVRYFLTRWGTISLSRHLLYGVSYTKLYISWRLVRTVGKIPQCCQHWYIGNSSS